MSSEWFSNPIQRRVSDDGTVSRGGCVERIEWRHAGNSGPDYMQDDLWAELVVHPAFEACVEGFASTLRSSIGRRRLCIMPCFRLDSRLDLIDWDAFEFASSSTNR